MKKNEILMRLDLFVQALKFMTGKDFQVKEYNPKKKWYELTQQTLDEEIEAIEKMIKERKGERNDL